MKITRLFGIILILTLVLIGCGSSAPKELIKADFADGQYYAVAYLGYQDMIPLDYYVGNYLDGTMPPVHYLSGEEYYLIIPRYEGMDLMLSHVGMLTSDSYKFYTEQDAGPFIVCCNISDIIPNVLVQLTYQGQTYEFSPHISLKDGSVEIGEWGLNLGLETE